ncbi:hypothetical protein GCM10022404_03520 [Celeribacter arenosi]|uniref:Uncharacterized protein n=1 Tax=Celeribacter arenosi TaxID=792649 RepID=A0ABP7JW56_9RHOB
MAEKIGDTLHDLAQLFEATHDRAGTAPVDCTLSEVGATTCFKITFAANRPTYTLGPWCPTNNSDDADGICDASARSPRP